MDAHDRNADVVQKTRRTPTSKCRGCVKPVAPPHGMDSPQPRAFSQTLVTCSVPRRLRTLPITSPWTGPTRKPLRTSRLTLNVLLARKSPRGARYWTSPRAGVTLLYGKGEE